MIGKYLFRLLVAIALLPVFFIPHDIFDVTPGEVSLPLLGIREITEPIIVWFLLTLVLISIMEFSVTTFLITLLSAIPFGVGTILSSRLEKSIALRAEKQPALLSRRPVATKFDDGHTFCAEYLKRLENYQKTGGIDLQVSQSLHQSALLNILMLSRGILNDHPPLGANANLMHYEASQDRLIVLASTDFQSFDSIVNVWTLDRDEFLDPSSHPGVCVRAFRSKTPICQPEMISEEVRKDEPITAMLSFPVIDVDEVRDGDLAVLNINYFVSGYVPKKLKARQKERLAKIQELCAKLNDLRHASDE